MLAKLVFLCLACALVAADFRVLPADGCGGEIKQVRAKPCDSYPCVVSKSDKTELEVDFVSNQDSETLKLSIFGRVGGRDIPFPGLEAGVDGCAAGHFSCPIVKGQAGTYKINLEVPASSPDILTTATFKLEGGDGTVFCFRIRVRVE